VSAQSFVPIVQHNGQPATRETLAPLAFSGFAHFTAMQVRDRRIRGLDLHLERLRMASLALFGVPPEEDRLHAYLRATLENGPADLSLTVTLHSPTGEFVAEDVAAPDVLIRTGPASSGPQGPLSLALFEHERYLPTIKHVGEGAKTHLLRQAVAQGFDDVLFVDRHGRISEGSIWNIAFWDGSTMVWPQADKLAGTTMGIVRRQLARLGIPQREQEITPVDLPGFAGAALMNSWSPGVAVHRIGSTLIPRAPAFMELLHHAYGQEPLVEP